jgi:hypothetical protein
MPCLTTSVKINFFYNISKSLLFSQSQPKITLFVQMNENLLSLTQKVYLGIQHDFWSSVPARCNVFRQTSGVVVIGIRNPKNKNKICNFWTENSHLEGVVSFY